MSHATHTAATPAEAVTHAVSGDEAMQNRRERIIAGWLLIAVVLAVALIAVLVFLFGLAALNFVALGAAAVSFVLLIAYATGY